MNALSARDDSHDRTVLPPRLRERWPTLYWDNAYERESERERESNPDSVLGHTKFYQLLCSKGERDRWPTLYWDNINESEVERERERNPDSVLGHTHAYQLLCRSKRESRLPNSITLF